MGAVGGATPTFLRNHGFRLLLFGGKGGVGKTTSATATALLLARSHPKAPFLLVSTDPAHSITHSLAGCSPPPNLQILELNASDSLLAFKEKHGWKLREIALRGTFLDGDDIQPFLDLSLPGLDELMAFLEIFKWVEEQHYKCIIVDTAPAGHTIRLLAMPKWIRKWLSVMDALLAKHRYMRKVFSASCQRDELDCFLEEMLASTKRAEMLLRDPVRCRFVPVMLAESMSIRETSSLLDELQQLRVPVDNIIVNKIYPDNPCPICSEGRTLQMEGLKDFLSQTSISKYIFWGVPLQCEEICGLKSLDAFWTSVSELTQSHFHSPGAVATDHHPLVTVLYEGRWEGHRSPPQVVGSRSKTAPPTLNGPTVSTLRVDIAAESPLPDADFLLFAGKGGVGKTTLACATALRLAHELRGREIFLFSMDSYSLSSCLEGPIGPQPTRVFPGLTAMEIDAPAEFQDLKAHYEEELKKFMESILRNLDLTFDQRVMERILDLSPPGLDEVMALTHVMEFLEQSTYDVFILDSAPTGHLIRLLELPELIDQWLKAFFGLFLRYKEIFRLPKISQRLIEMSKNLKRLRALLVNPTRASLYAVSIPTEMAFEETKNLMATCERMGIHVPALFLNLATPYSQCSLCSALYRRESAVRDKYQQTFSNLQHALIYREGELRGLSRLENLGRMLYQPVRKEAVVHGD